MILRELRAWARDCPGLMHNGVRHWRLLSEQEYGCRYAPDGRRLVTGRAVTW